MLSAMLRVASALHLGAVLALHVVKPNQRGQRLGVDRIAPLPACSTLTNVEGTHYTIAVAVGDPPQLFDLVADTGSPWVIVEDCVCKDEGYCDPMNKCFQHSLSRTFAQPKTRGRPSAVVLQFGSGPIEVQISTDVVAVPGTTYNQTFKNGVLTMVDHKLGFEGQFEGIFGLGLDERQVTLHEPLSSRAANGQHYADGFLTRAGVKYFTVCLNDDSWSGDYGTITYNGKVDKIDQRLSINQDSVHWQVALNGATVEGDTGILDFCDPASMPAGRDSPCAAILDSGTTYILGPEDQVLALFRGICMRWPRCASLLTQVANARAVLAEKNITTDVSMFDAPDQMFRVLISDCESWYNQKVGLTELPSITFHVSSGTSHGPAKDIVLDPWTWVIKEETRRTAITFSDIEGVGTVPSGYETELNKTWGCTLAFGAMDYPTTRNGPAWILGVPLFFGYAVNYDMTTKPPSVGLSTQSCDSCAGPATGQKRFQTRRGGPKKPRNMTGAPHIPKSAKAMTAEALHRH